MIKAIIGDSTYLLQSELEQFFQQYHQHVSGYNYHFETPYGKKKMIYADWTASGRLYNPIESKIQHQIGPLVGNTHTETNVTGTTMTEAYHHAQQVIKQHVNANEDDIIIMDGSGMTSVVNKLQRLLGLRVPSNIKANIAVNEEDRPIIFL
nr:hypothetical protein [Litchfieldia alkalitelluris]